MSVRLGGAHPHVSGIRSGRRGFGRRDRLHLRVVVVKTLLGLPAEHAGLVARAHNEIRTVARLLEELGVDELGCRLRHVETGQLHQFERPHAEAAHIAHDAVDVDKARDTLVDEMRCFQRKAAADLIDQKTRRVGAAYRLARHAPADRHQGFGHPILGLQPVDHLDQLHQRHRVEEMEAGETLRGLELGGDRRHRQRGRIGDEDAIGSHDGFELGEKLALGIEIFDDCFDHDMTRFHVGRTADDLDAAYCGNRRVLAHAALLGGAGEHFIDEIARFLRSAGATVGHQNVHAARGRDLGDAASHRAGADHADRQIGSVCVEVHGFP